MTNSEVHIVVDLETAGTQPGSVILQIGAAAFSFDPSWNPNNADIVFNQFISEKDSLREGFTEDSSTLKWWKTQRPELMKLVFSGKSTVMEVLDNFHDWLHSLVPGDSDEKNLILWGNGADFDLVLLREYYNHMGYSTPWDFRNVRCFRTLKALFPSLYTKVKDAYEPNSNPHYALSDAIWEANILYRMLQNLHSFKGE